MESNIQVSCPVASWKERREELLEALISVLESGLYILGPHVDDFEAAFSSYLNIRHCVGVANGTDAIELALRAAGVEAGQAVFTVSHTAVATVAAIERMGAIPVLVDIEPTSYTMCPTSLQASIEAFQEKKLPNRAKKMGAIIAVHLYGNPCQMDQIMSLSQSYGIPLIEDCAQAHGAKWHGQMVGSIGTIGTFSFYPTKNLGAFGDGGAVVTNERILDTSLRGLREYGWTEKRYISSCQGINSRLDSLQAALLKVQLSWLDRDVARRNHIAACYNQAFEVLEDIDIPLKRPHTEHAYHLYVLSCPERDTLAQVLRAQGINTAIHYPVPVHQQPAYAGRILTDPRGLHVTEHVCSRIISLPMYPQLDDTDVSRVIAAIRAYYGATL